LILFKQLFRSAASTSRQLDSDRRGRFAQLQSVRLQRENKRAADLQNAAREDEAEILEWNRFRKWCLQNGQFRTVLQYFHQGASFGAQSSVQRT
jgi:hypothetical protein